MLTKLEKDPINKRQRQNKTTLTLKTRAAVTPTRLLQNHFS